MRARACGRHFFFSPRRGDPVVERGKYLVTIASCNDRHTPGYFLGKPDFSRRLEAPTSDSRFLVSAHSLAAISRRMFCSALAIGPTIRSSPPSRRAFGRTDEVLPRSCRGRVYRIYPPTTRTPSSPISEAFRRSRTPFQGHSGRRKSLRRWSLSSFQAMSTPRCRRRSNRRLQTLGD